MFTVRNTAILAIMQIGVIVVGTLAAGLCHKLFADTPILMPWPAELLYSYGIAGFLIPLTWSTIALLIERQPNLSDDVRDFAFVSGILILVFLIGFVLCADLLPWLNGEWYLQNDNAQ